MALPKRNRGPSRPGIQNPIDSASPSNNAHQQSRGRQQALSQRPVNPSSENRASADSDAMPMPMPAMPSVPASTARQAPASVRQRQPAVTQTETAGMRASDARMPSGAGASAHPRTDHGVGARQAPARHGVSQQHQTAPSSTSDPRRDARPVRRPQRQTDGPRRYQPSDQALASEQSMGTMDAMSPSQASVSSGERAQSPPSSRESHPQGVDEREARVLAAFRSGKLASRRYNAIHDKMRPLATAHRPFHYPGWNGPGYPKGAGHGPIVWRYDDKKDKVVQVEGMAYEDLRSPGSDEKSSWQKMLDKDPYDIAGQLRIFRRGTSGTMAIYEWGSDQGSVMQRAEMETRSTGLNDKSVNLSWSSRPRLDNRDDVSKMTFPDKGAKKSGR